MVSRRALYMGVWCSARYIIGGCAARYSSILFFWLMLWCGAVVDGSPLLVRVGDAAAGEVVEHTFGVGVELVVLIFPVRCLFIVPVALIEVGDSRLGEYMALKVR